VFGVRVSVESAGGVLKFVVKLGIGTPYASVPGSISES
jgi:hypothetical protein